MKWKDENTAKELLKNIDECRNKIDEYNRLISLSELSLIDLTIIQNAEYVFDKLIYDVDNNFWKCRINGTLKIYKWNDWKTGYKQLYSERHLKEYLDELFEEGIE